MTNEEHIKYCPICGKKDNIVDNMNHDEWWIDEQAWCESCDIRIMVVV